ncbi:MATE family efflux transporter [Syntrophaceticus schinkii]|jgi:putative MATE family efflux protein|uniref:Putative multidrug resistance protein yoeA n=1 Tax=Syntrophaceticus schinkii TaxID=499207 RepID=A0A0B7MQP4_9FIRM|nr:MATE family efflux transporter [Syntrophaceticus schinkii]MDD2360352.1 MATE family efflux transporter [Syntrophaceticus schinkii]MDD4262050.1 MATE family efflux transporter [Syntrophaceticus schinkii]MDD4675388.1 MATE family efflux transporter [Syntrophaceticus schinkii]CEO90478.1 putative multidrug resistance protein yoeA [Syntrophaceticus schinkii]
MDEHSASAVDGQFEEKEIKKSRIDLEGSLWKGIFIFVLPLMLSNFLNSVSGTISSIILGRMIGVSALAAVSAFFPVFFFLVSFVIGIGGGSSVLIGQAFGAQEWKKVKIIVGTTLTSTFLLGLLLAIPGLLFTHNLLELTGTPADIIETSAGFARIIFLAMPVLFLFNVYTTFMRGSGDSTTPFYFLLISTILNILLIPALVIGWGFLPAMGVNGAALANVISGLLTFAIFLIYLNKTNHPLQLDRETLRHLRIDWPIFKLLISIGIPTSIQMVMISLAAVAVISFVNSFGSNATAAFGAVQQVVSYVQMPAGSLGMAVSIFGAQAIGAGYNKKLNKIIRTGVWMNYIIIGIFALLAYFFGREILSLFLTDIPTLNMAYKLLVITLWSYPIFGNANILAGIMRASGVVFWPTLIAIFSIWGAEVPVAYIMHTRIGLEGVMFGFPAAFITMLILQYCYYHFFWKQKEHARLV